MMASELLTQCHHYQQRAADGDRVLDEGGGAVAAERGGELRAECAPAEGADDCADGPGQKPANPRPTRGPDARAGEAPVSIRAPN
jgi:hypothetical protein